MAYCHECGSEVAPNDVYCPYCGIFLSPASSDDTKPDAAETSFVEEDEEFSASTMGNAQEIVSTTETDSNANDDFSLSDTEESLDLSEANENFTPKTDETFEKQPEEPILPPIADTSENIDSTEDFSLAKNQSNNDSADFSVDNIPTPSLIDETSPNYGASFQNFDRQQNEIQSENENFGIGAENAESFSLSEEKNETPFEKENPISINAENNISEETGKTSETANVKKEKDPFSETIPDLSSALAAHSKIEESANSAFENSESAVDANEESSKIVDFSKDETVSEEIAPEIEMPSEELETPDIHVSQAVFDSVRIMETEPEKEDAKFEEPIASSFVESIAQIPEIQTPISEKSDELKENVSYTTPNIGGSDTDGRKAKLKPLDEGTILNSRYEIIRKIGGGGMGAVYLASDNNLGGVLRAVKEMVQSYIEETQQDKAIADFKRESMILSTLDHPSIPTIYDYFYDDKESRFYLVMKYISGGDLSSRLRSAPEGKLDEKTVTEWAIQITDVLSYLHNQPNTIVYRDLKPSNVMIDGNSGRIMLIDFGIARSVNKEEKGVTAVGTMGYAPPELFSGNVEPRSDIYSLGSTMFHLLTGADPQSNPLLIFDFQKNPRPRQINSQLSDQMERILMKAVEYNSSARFASAVELKQVLQEHLANLNAGRVTYGVSATPVAVSLQDQPVFCGFCGQKIMATDMFCAFCGSKQPLSQKGVHSEIYSHSFVTAKLMVLGTNELDSPVFSIERDENLVGRRDPMSNIFPEVDLSKFDPQTKISRRHARIRRDGNNFYVEDLGSSNGTIIIPAVNDMTRLLPHQPHVLANGDKIRIGDTTLHFVIN